MEIGVSGREHWRLESARKFFGSRRGVADRRHGFCDELLDVKACAACVDALAPHLDRSARTRKKRVMESVGELPAWRKNRR